jgi:hypothetical protein
MDNPPSLPLPVGGDRVDVLYAAEVKGEYDVVYETGGAVGSFVTREELRLLPLDGG